MSNQDMNHELLEYLDQTLVRLRDITSSGEKNAKKLDNLLTQKNSNKFPPEVLQALSLDSRVPNRRFTIKATTQLTGVSYSAISAAEESGRLPPPDMRTDTKKEVRAGYTVNQLNVIRRVFGRVPTRPRSDHPPIIGIANLKGGAGKTTTTQFFSHYLAQQGYRVLLVDTDPQGSLSFTMGKPQHAVKYEDTMAPYLLRDETALIEAGFEPGASESLHYAIQKTYFSEIDIIPACLDNLAIDLHANSKEQRELNEMLGITPADAYAHLRAGLHSVGDEYDFILIDGTPSLNITTLNVIVACDLMFVPTPAAMLDYFSTLKFTEMITNSLEHFASNGIPVNCPDIRFFITKYFPRDQYTKFMVGLIMSTFGISDQDVLRTCVAHSKEVQKAASEFNSIYEANPVEADNRAKLKETLENYDDLFSEMLDVVWESFYADVRSSPKVEKGSAALGLDELLSDEKEQVN